MTRPAGRAGLLLLILLACAGAGSAAPKDYRVVLRIVRLADSESLRDCSLWLWARDGRGQIVKANRTSVIRIEKPRGAQRRELSPTAGKGSGAGIALPDGDAVLVLAPGYYAVNADHPDHEKAGFAFQVPPNGYQGGRDITYTFGLTPRGVGAEAALPAPSPQIESSNGGERGKLEVSGGRDEASRTLIVVIRGPRGAAGLVGPIADATVEFRLEDGRTASTRTSSAGEAFIRSAPQVLGRQIRVRVTADGFHPREQLVSLPTRQPSGKGDLAPNVSQADRTEIRLQSLASPANGAELLVRVQDVRTRQPVPEALVRVETVIGSEVIGRSVTGPDGSTEALPLLFADRFNLANGKQANYQVRVDAAGFQQHLAPVSNSFVRPGEAAEFTVLLEPGENAPPVSTSAPSASPDRNPPAAKPGGIASFIGEWQTFTGSLAYELGLTLTQNADRVTGVVSDAHPGGRPGTLEGTVRANKLEFRCRFEGGKQGDYVGEIELSRDGQSFKGTWRIESDRAQESLTPWRGVRKDRGEAPVRSSKQ